MRVIRWKNSATGVESLNITATGIYFPVGKEDGAFVARYIMAAGGQTASIEDVRSPAGDRVGNPSISVSGTTEVIARNRRSLAYGIAVTAISGTLTATLDDLVVRTNWPDNLGRFTAKEDADAYTYGGTGLDGCGATIAGVPSTYQPEVGWVAQNLTNPANANDIVALGNSITEQNGGRFSLGGSDNYFSCGFIVNAVTQTGGTFRLLENFGIGGQNSSDMLARINQVLRSPARIVVFTEVTNDSGRGMTPEQLFPIYKRIISTILSAGKICICCTGIPRGSMTAEQLAYYTQMNSLIMAYKATGYYPCDIASPMTDPVTQMALPKTLRDGTHPNAYGAYLMSGPLVSVLNLVKSTQRDIVMDAQSTGVNALTNPFFSGTASGPTSWNIQAAPTSWSVVSRTDGIPQQTVRANCNPNINVLITQNVDISKFPVGSVLRGYVKVLAEDINQAATANTQTVGARIQLYNGSSFTKTADAAYWDATVDKFENIPMGGMLLFRTPPIIVTTGTQLVQIVFGASGGGKYTLLHAYMGPDPE